MDKQTCEIVRDVLPLVADDVASEATKQFAEGHMLECESCRTLYQQMTAKSSEAPAKSEEDTGFIQLCRKLEKRFKLQKILMWTGVLVVIAALILGSGAFINDRMYHRTTAMPIEWVNLKLYQTEDGRIVECYTMMDGHRWYGSGSFMQFTRNAAYICPSKPEWAIGKYPEYGPITYELSDFRLVDGELVFREYFTDVVFDNALNANIEKYRYEDTPLRELNLGTLEHHVNVYSEGDSIPLLPENITVDN